MDITNEQIIQEFKRQVRLCGGIGKAEMLKIINEHFQNPKEPEAVHGNEAEKEVCDYCFVGTSKQVGNMYICPKCGASVP